MITKYEGSGKGYIVKDRDYLFDNTKILLIILVVIGHLIEPMIEGRTLKPLYIFIYIFHMPLFIFISGYFSKNFTTKRYSEKIITHLVVPYVSFEIIYSLFDYYIITKEANNLVFNFFTPYWILWFLFSMIIWKVALPYVVNIKGFILLPASIIIGILVGYASDIGYYASLSRTIVFFPFFLAGYYFDRKWLDRFRYFRYRLIAIALIGLTFLCVYLLAPFIDRIRFLYQSVPYSSLDLGLEGGIYRFIYYSMATLLGLCLLLIIPNKRIPLLTAAGKFTIYPYLLHGFIVLYLRTTGFYHNLSTFEKGILIILGIFIALLLSMGILRSMFKWIIEPKLSYAFNRISQDKKNSS